MQFLMGSALWWGIGALIASIPIIIHLLHRQKTQPVLWGAMIFLRMSLLQQKRRKRIENLLLLLLRVALLALLVALLARPLWESAAAVGLSSRPASDIAIVLDHSLSTRWKSGDTTLYDQAVATLTQLTQQGTLKPNDTVSIVLAEKTPRKLTPVPVNSDALPGVLAQLRNQKPGSTRASISDAIQAARDVLSRGRHQSSQTILVVSDGQRTNWDINNLSAWNSAVGQRVKGVEPNPKVYELTIAPPTDRANLTVQGLTISPAVAGVNRPLTITTSIVNSGTKEMPATTASLWVDGKQSGLKTPVRALKASGSDGQRDSQSLTFEHTFANANSHWLEVKLDGVDGFDADNSATAGVFVHREIPVLIIDGSSAGGEMADASDPAALDRFRGSFYLSSAMLADAKDVDSPAFLSPTIISYSDGTRLRDLANNKLRRDVKGADGSTHKETIGLDSFACVILNDVPRLDTTIQNRLIDYCRGGHGLWYILGKRTEPMFIRDQIAGANIFKMELNSEQGSADKPVAVDVRDTQHDVFRPFVSQERNVLTGMTTLKWWSIKPMEGDAQTQLATASPDPESKTPGDPLILEHVLGSAGGRVIVWTSPVDGTSGWNNWTTMKAFPPMVNLTAYRLAGGLTKGLENRVESGKALVWASPVLQDAKSADSLGGSASAARQLVFPDGTVSPPVQWAEALSPTGQKARVKPVTRDGRQWAYFGDTFEPGKYEVRFDQTAIPPVFFGVGIDPAELDPTPLSLDDRKWLGAEDHKFIEKTIEAKDLGQMFSTGGSRGLDLWPWLAGVLLAILLFETYMTYRMVRRQSGPAVAMGAMPTPIPPPAASAA